MPLPPGLELSPDGVLFGTPAQPGMFGFTVTVTDAVGASASTALTLAVTSTQPPTVGDIDAWAAANPVLAQLFTMAAQQPGVLCTTVIAGWTRADGSHHFAHVPDPRTDPRSAAMLQGILAAGHGVTVRAYQFAFSAPPPSSLAAPVTVQQAAGDPAAWAPV